MTGSGPATPRVPPAGLLTVVIPTLGRPSLTALLASLLRSAEHTGLPLPRLRVVDDRPAGGADLLAALPAEPPVVVLRSGGRGPAAARNAGWRGCQTEWIAFLDDDVTVTPNWLADLVDELAGAAPSVAGSQGRISVPLPADRRPTDWERGTAGLQAARWITADMAYRTAVLEQLGGFDERFPAAFREDADLALAVLDAGYRLERGLRRTVHPVRPAGWWASVRQQRGNADDILMARLHGADWRRRAAAPLGRRPLHLLTTAAGLLGLVTAAAGRRRTAGWLAAGWLAGTAEFSARRIVPGPRDRREVARMISTSVLIPPLASWHWSAGLIRHRAVTPRPPLCDPISQQSRRVVRSQAAQCGSWAQLPAAVLLDRDGTIIRDVPYNGDPALVESMPGARLALDRLRQAGIPLAVISNQSGIARGWLDTDQVAAVNARVEELLGPFDAWAICPHVDADRCQCRKPLPGLIHRAADQLRVNPEQCLVIGDIGADIEAARAVAARSILVPTGRTRAEEVRDAPVRAASLADAVELVLTGGDRE